MILNNDVLKKEKIYEGKAKILYSTDNPEFIIQYFKDDATAFNGEKKEVLTDKGILNNLISDYLMQQIIAANIPNHYIKKISDREQLIKKLDIIPLELIVRNISAGSIVKRLGVQEGLVFNCAVIEFCYKNDSLGDPLINDDHIIKLLKILDQKQLNQIKNFALDINNLLKDIFDKIDIILVDFKIEFGFSKDRQILLADEISPDSARLWDKNNMKKLDKDRFRRDLGGVVEAYKEVASRLGIL